MDCTHIYSGEVSFSQGVLIRGVHCSSHILPAIQPTVGGLKPQPTECHQERQIQSFVHFRIFWFMKSVTNISSTDSCLELHWFVSCHNWILGWAYKLRYSSPSLLLHTSAPRGVFEAIMKTHMTYAVMWRLNMLCVPGFLIVYFNSTVCTLPSNYRCRHLG